MDLGPIPHISWLSRRLRRQRFPAINCLLNGKRLVEQPVMMCMYPQRKPVDIRKWNLFPVEQLLLPSKSLEQRNSPRRKLIMYILWQRKRWKVAQVRAEDSTIGIQRIIVKSVIFADDNRIKIWRAENLWLNFSVSRYYLRSECVVSWKIIPELLKVFFVNFSVLRTY